MVAPGGGEFGISQLLTVGSQSYLGAGHFLFVTLCNGLVGISVGSRSRLAPTELSLRISATRLFALSVIKRNQTFLPPVVRVDVTCYTWTCPLLIWGLRLVRRAEAAF